MKRLLILSTLFLFSQSLFAQEFKVGTYNIFTSDSRVKAINKNPQVSPQRYWCNSAPAVASMISSLDCDILGVQEVCDSIWGVKGENDIKKLVAEQGKVDYDWVLYPNSKSGKIQYDVAIAYKKAMFNLLESGIFYLGGVRDSAIVAPKAPKGTQRPCVWAHLEHKDSGKDFYFLSVHFLVPKKKKDGTSDVSGNKYNMQRLREITMDMIPADTPSILVGDFNADHKSKHWGSIGNARWFDLFQHYIAAGTMPSDIKDWGTQNTKDEASLTKWKPDHIGLHMFRPLDISVDKRKFPTADGTMHYPSDHLPVTARVAFIPEVDQSIYNTPAPVNPKTVRIVSSNIRFWNNNQDLENGWDRRKTAVTSMMKDLKPAVIGFQECNKYQRDYILGHCPDYEYVDYLNRRKKNLRSYAAFTDPVMWDRNVLELLEWDAFYLSETPDTCSMSWDSAEPRTALWCRFKHKKTGKEFIFINTHLDHKGVEARKNGLEVLLNKMEKVNTKKLPMVVLGDFNAQYKETATLERIKAEWKDARMEAKDSDDKYTFNGFGKTWNGTVDYIWYKGFKRCHDFKVIVRKYNHVPFISDHYPIRADLEF